MFSKIYTATTSLYSSKAGRDVRGLVLGASSAQLIMVVSSPLLTRLYSPSAFGVLSLYLSIIAVLNTICSLRYELAIAIAETDTETKRLLYLVFVLTLATSLMFELIVLGFHAQILQLLGSPKFGLLLYLVPLGLLCESLRQAAKLAAIRKQSFRLIAQNDVGQSASRTALQTSFGAFWHSSFYLILGDLISRGAFAAFITVRVSRQLGPPDFSRPLTQLKELALRYKKFPIFSAPASLVAGLKLALPILLLTRWYGSTIAGLYGLTIQVIGLPLLLIGTAVFQVSLGRASSLLRSQGSVYTHYRKTLNIMTLTGITVIAPVVLIGSYFAGTIFGPEWSETGLYMRILVPYSISIFIATGLDQILIILNRQGLAFGIEVARTVLLLGGLFVAHSLSPNPTHAIAYISIAGSTGYLGQTFIAMWIVKRTDQQQAILLAATLPETDRNSVLEANGNGVFAGESIVAD